MTDTVQDNRNRLVEISIEHELKVMNTQYRKTKDKLAPYRAVGTRKTDEIRRPTHEQVDYLITTQRWKNTVIDAEADNDANIDTDHNPVKMKIRLKLKGTIKPTKQRNKYKK